MSTPTVTEDRGRVRAGRDGASEAADTARRSRRVPPSGTVVAAFAGAATALLLFGLASVTSMSSAAGPPGAPAGAPGGGSSGGTGG